MGDRLVNKETQEEILKRFERFEREVTKSRENDNVT